MPSNPEHGGAAAYDLFPFPAGVALAVARAGMLERLELYADAGAAERGRARHCPEARADAGAVPLPAVRRQLAEYFAGRRRDFELPLAAAGTEFERRVWRELLAIPYGATRSYGDLARTIGHPAASRAVGRANGRNPIAVVIPCHRVIGADGSLTGYGGGLPLKRLLLDLEAAGRQASLPFAGVERGDGRAAEGAAEG